MSLDEWDDVKRGNRKGNGWANRCCDLWEFVAHLRHLCPRPSLHRNIPLRAFVVTTKHRRLAFESSMLNLDMVLPSYEQLDWYMTIQEVLRSSCYKKMWIVRWALEGWFGFGDFCRGCRVLSNFEFWQHVIRVGVIQRHPILIPRSCWTKTFSLVSLTNVRQFVRKTCRSM